MAAVIKPFNFAPDGFSIERLVEGDERDFGNALEGLVKEGFVSDDTTPSESAKRKSQKAE